MYQLLAKTLSDVLAFLRRDNSKYRLRRRVGRSSPYSAEALEVRVLLSNVYVATTGNDSANGSAATPWKTLQYAANHVQPGDTVLVSAGTYQGFELTTSGTAANRITFQGQAGVTINSPGATGDDIDLEGASYVTIDGFTTTNAARAGIRSVINHDVIIRNNDADQNQMWGIFTSYSDYVDIENNTASRSAVEHGIYVSHATQNPIIRDNTVWGNYVNGIHMNSGVNESIVGALVQGNVIYNNGAGGGSAISCDGIQNATIENNLLYGNHFLGISLYRSTSTLPSMGNHVQDNTVVMAPDGYYALNIRNASINNVVQDNIFTSMLIDADCIPGYQADDNAIVAPPGQTPKLSADLDNTHLTLAGWQQVTGQDPHSMILTTDQVFVNYSQGDYRLNPASPLQNIGYQAGASPAQGTAFHFEFGTPASPTAAGYTAVNEGTSYNPIRGYGWQSGVVSSRYDTSAGLTAVQASYDYTKNATFAVDLPNGSYNVTVTMGDAGWMHDQQGVFLQGSQVDSVTTQARQFSTQTYSATVTNGQLSLSLRDLGGSDPNVVINTVDIVQVSPPVAPPASSGSFHFEFGTATSPTATGYTAVNEGTTYSATRGYGWQSGVVSSRYDTSTGLTAVQASYDYTKNATFAVDLPNGSYSVTVTMGDAGWMHDQQGVFLQGSQVDSVTTQVRQFSTQTYSATVANGQLSLALRDLGGSDPNVVINAVDIVQVSPPVAPPASSGTFHFEFGTATSPTAAGYTAVNEGTSYSATRGYGWQSGVVSSRYDTSAGLTTVQASYDYTKNATFAVDLANGTYNVTVTMGDAGWSHDLQGVFLQGAQVDSVTTAVRQFYVRTYSVTVANGQLTLQLQDLGGNDPNVVINALDIVKTA